ncbi:hypothetical protein PN419_09850 [Halorubrum ezzemoulense]|uniref:hypothetical protein n=1 Tax=Halorubrum ezzemoulense TaxID=337243 RepID=UPI00232CEDD2|nr:hypothetical protein [Halorubrum ezzemoulense]MDB9249296.1 hypothetical protein [Halorubrum ezzemoulense]MDB9259548.1 hypothetical protein [Halorubrum ezzemoulense]MDB9263014.1 hypothetical protein [Halorubrum ezzemoulense]MDB9266556.1 hypothetical protein [Halorubrum ezzemoulense]MDB9269909.1 hypothetical protein [Halorubrum ezzemoulense]
MKPEINQLNEGDILRIDYHSDVFDQDGTVDVVVDSVSESEEEIEVGFVDEWNDTLSFKLIVSESEAYLSGDVWQKASVSSTEMLGEVPPDFGMDYILFRPQPYRDHILRKSVTGKFENICKHNVNTHDGEKIREDKVTRRQRSLVNICAGCSSYLHDHLREKLPERMERSSIDEDTPFLCPHCGEPPERFEHVEMLGGMFSYHDDGEKCGPWSGQAYLEWRLEGSNRK